MNTGLDYLARHPEVQCLQPGHFDPLYQTIYGAVTLDHAAYLEAVRARVATVRPPMTTERRSPAYDAYSNQEDTFIDQHQMGSTLL